MERGEVSESKAERHDMIITRRTYGSIARDDGPWLLCCLAVFLRMPVQELRAAAFLFSGRTQHTTAASSSCPRVPKRGYPFASRFFVGQVRLGFGVRAT